MSLRAEVWAGGLDGDLRSGVSSLFSMIRRRLNVEIGLFFVEAGGVWRESILRLEFGGDVAGVFVVLMLLIELGSGVK